MPLWTSLWRIIWSMPGDRREGIIFVIRNNSFKKLNGVTVKLFYPYTPEGFSVKLYDRKL